jgi:hypothetical protein
MTEYVKGKESLNSPPLGRQQTRRSLHIPFATKGQFQNGRACSVSICRLRPLFDSTTKEGENRCQRSVEMVTFGEVFEGDEIAANQDQFGPETLAAYPFARTRFCLSLGPCKRALRFLNALHSGYSLDE